VIVAMVTEANQDFCFFYSNLIVVHYAMLSGCSFYFYINNTNVHVRWRVRSCVLLLQDAV